MNKSANIAGQVELRLHSLEQNLNSLIVKQGMFNVDNNNALVKCKKVLDVLVDRVEELERRVGELENDVI